MNYYLHVEWSGWIVAQGIDELDEETTISLVLYARFFQGNQSRKESSLVRCGFPRNCFPLHS